MSADASFRCPVCRASQTLRETCRRCQADLRLVVGVRRRIDYLVGAREQARDNGDSQRERIVTEELRWLAPHE
jgi:hypothetical protein